MLEECECSTMSTPIVKVSTECGVEPIYMKAIPNFVIGICGVLVNLAAGGWKELLKQLWFLSHLPMLRVRRINNY